MRQITSAFRSGKIATLLALSLAGLYAATEFGSHPAQQAVAALSPKSVQAPIPDAIDFQKISLVTIPKPMIRPANLPFIAQPHQFDVVSLTRKWANLSFDLTHIRDGAQVPRYFVEEIPVDILDVEHIKDRKRIFLSVALPLILKVNEEIREDRALLEEMQILASFGAEPDTDEKAWLTDLAEKYNGNVADLDDLLRRVDTIPVSLALAQSIEESGWGTSRFAREGNALFGQRVWATGNGLVPAEREEGKSYEVKAFDRLLSSIRDYARNLNSFHAYQDFRTERARLKKLFGTVNGYDLSHALTSYSERGEHYTDTLQMLIRVNNLGQFDDARLAPERVAQIFN